MGEDGWPDASLDREADLLRQLESLRAGGRLRGLVGGASVALVKRN